MVSETVCILNSSGIHARPASVLTRTASDFRCDIRIICQDRCINAKNILDVMNAGIKYKTELVITCEGEDEMKALQAMKDVIHHGLGE